MKQIKTPVNKDDPNFKTLQFIDDWVHNLNLGHLEPMIIFEPRKYVYGFTKAAYYFNPVHQKYCIIIGTEVKNDKYTLLHEVGHLNLEEITNKSAYCKKIVAQGKITEKKTTPLSYLMNAIEDAFVNYNLSKVKRAYPILTSHYKPQLLKIEKEKVKKLPYFGHIGQYIYYYLIYNYVLKPSKNPKQLQAQRANLTTLKKIAINRTKN